MICRSAVSRAAQTAARRQPTAVLAQQRGYAATTGNSTESASFTTSEVEGVKFASREASSPTARLALVVKGGTRYQPLPGLTVGLEGFAFKGTNKRSALRIARETELLGGELKAYHTRENLVLETAFLKDDLPYFAELLAEVISNTRYTTHEFNEEVTFTMHLAQQKVSQNSLGLAIDAAHSIAFHKGLGSSIFPATSAALGPYLSENSIAEYANLVYTKPRIAVVADGASQSEASKWVGEFFAETPATPESKAKLYEAESKYYGGEQRLPLATSNNAMVIAFPGYSLSSDKAEAAVLTALLGGKSSISWTPGFALLGKAAAKAPGVKIEAKNFAYSDTGLLAIQLTGSAQAVKKGAQEAVEALKSIVSGGVSKEDLTKAIAKAKFELLTANELTGAGMVSAGSSLIQGGKVFQVADAIKSYEGVTADKVKAAAKTLLEGKASVSAVGDLFVLPFAEDLGLKV